MSALSNTFWAYCSVHSEERATSLLVEGFALTMPTRSARNPFQVRDSVRPMHLFGHTFDHDYYFELPVKGSGIPTQLLDVLLHTIAISGFSRVRTELSQLLVIPFLPQHPVQTNGRLARHGHLHRSSA